MAIILPLAFFNCAPVQFSVREASLTESSLSACERNEEIKCRVDNGWGIAVCGGSSFGACNVQYCDPGYDLVNGACQAQACTPTVEVACSTNYNLNTIGVGIGSCNSTGGSATTCQAWECLNGYTKEGEVCRARCTPGEIRQCGERNGLGSQICEGTGTSFSPCLLNSCEAGFVFDPDTRVCKSTSCLPGSTLACQTEWGPGTRACSSAGNYSPLCDPLQCPQNFTKSNYSCWPNICTATQIRNSQGVCIEKAICPTGSGKIVVNNSCVCPTGTNDINGVCGICGATEVYEPISKTCSLNCQAPLVKINNQCQCADTNQVFINNQCVSKDIGCSLTASSLIVAYNGSTLLSWSTLNSDKTTMQCSGQSAPHSVVANGTENYANIKSNSTCDLIATNLAGISKKCSLSIGVMAPPSATCDVTFSKNPANYNEVVTATMTGSNADPARSHVLACGTKSNTGSTLPVNLSLGAVTNNVVCTGKVYNLAGTEANCSSALTVNQPGVPGCTLAFNPNSIYNTQATSLTATFANVSSASLSCPNMTSLNGNITVQDGVIRNIPSLSQSLSCILSVQNIAGATASCSASITPQTAPTVSCSGLSFSSNPIGVGDSVTITATGTNIDPAKANKIVCGGVEVPLTAETGTVLQASLTNVTSSKTCTATLYNVVGQTANCASQTVTVAPNPTCTNIAFSKNPAIQGDNVNVTVSGSNIDPSKLNQVVCNGQSINLGTETSTQVIANLLNVQSNQSCTATLYNAANKSVQCNTIDLTVNAPAQCATSSFSKSTLLLGETSTLTLSGNGLNPTRAPLVSCGGGSLSFSTKTSTSFVATYTPSTTGNFNCNVTLYSTTGAALACPVAAISNTCSAGTSASGGQCVCNNGAINSPTCDTCAAGKIFINGTCTTTPVGSCSIAIKTPSGANLSGATAGTSLAAFWSVTNGNVSSYSCSNSSSSALSGSSGNVALTMPSSALSCTLSYKDLANVSKSCTSNSVAAYQCNPGEKDRSACTQPSNGYSERTCSASGTWGTCVVSCDPGWTGPTCTTMATTTKWCRFSSRRESGRMGINGCSNGGLGPAMTLGWLHFELATGFKRIDPNTATCVTGLPKWHYSFLGQDYGTVKWKNSTQPFTSTGSVLQIRFQSRSSGSSAPWGLMSTTYKQLTTWHKQNSIDTGPGAYFCNYDSNGKCIPSPAVKAVSGGEGQQKYNGVDPDSSPHYLNYVSEGDDGLGLSYRMIWQESSPGTSCFSPGTITLDANYQ